MKKLLIYLKPYVKECILGPLFKLLEASLDLIVPLVIAEIIDTGIGNSDSAYIVKMCVLLVALGFIGLGFSATAQFFAAKASAGFIAKIRQVLFKHIQSLSYTEIDEIGTSTMITRITSDANQVHNGVNITLRLLLRSPFIVFGAMIMAFTIDVKTALIFVGAIICLSIVIFGIMLISIPLYRKVQNRLDRVTVITRENLTGVRVIRAFCKEDEEIKKFDDSNEALMKMQQFAGKISALMNPVTYVIINIAIILLIYIGAIRVEAGLLTQGAIVALYNYLSQILIELIKLANLIITITKSVACGNRIQSVLEIESGEKENRENVKLSGKTDSVYAVEFENADLKYKGAADCSLSDIDFKVKKGETVGVIGGTGSGKSSLVNMIPGFYTASKGKVLVDGTDIKDYDLRALREKIGVVPQKAVLFSGTVRENIKWGKGDAGDDEINEALEIAQAKEIVDNKKEGLDYYIEQGGRNLSGGQKQRLTIARAVVKKPEILILDDSASALDFATDAALRKAIKNMRGNTTVFIVSQRASTVRYADKIVVLDDGRIAGIGTHDELMDGCQVYREIFESQYKKEEA